jgi:hypothetical protein
VSHVQLESTSLILIILALVVPLVQLRSIPLLLAPQVAPHVPLVNMVPQQEQPPAQRVWLVSIVLQLVRVLALVALLVIMHLPRALPLARSVL